MKKNSLFILLFLIIFGLTVEISTANTYVEPSKQIIILKPGEKTTGVIRVLNNSQSEIRVRACLYDWTLEAEDKLRLFAAGEQEDSLRELIKFNPRSFKLAPAAVQLVRFSLKIPEGEDFERKGIVFFEQERPQTEEGIGAQLLTQVGSTIYSIPNTAPFKFDLQSARLSSLKQGVFQGMIKVKNLGKAHIRYTVNYKIINQQNRLFLADSLSEKIILPGAQRELIFPIVVQLPPDQYNLLLDLHFDWTDKTLHRVIPFIVNSKRK